MRPFTIQDILEKKGLTSQQYHEQFLAQVEQPAKDDAMAEYRKMNWQRTSRIFKTHTLGAAITEELLQITNKQNWIVITETWCGDSSQSLPIIAQMAEKQPLITLKILLRDDNLEVMDYYAIEGKRSIPRVVGFSEDFSEELFFWGARPTKIQDEFQELLKTHSKSEAIAQVHSLYAKDKGQSLEAEFVHLLSALRAKK